MSECCRSSLAPPDGLVNPTGRVYFRCRNSRHLLALPGLFLDNPQRSPASTSDDREQGSHCDRSRRLTRPSDGSSGPGDAPADLPRGQRRKTPITGERGTRSCKPRFQALPWAGSCVSAASSAAPTCSAPLAGLRNEGTHWHQRPDMGCTAQPGPTMPRGTTRTPRCGLLVGCSSLRRRSGHRPAGCACPQPGRGTQDERSVHFKADSSFLCYLVKVSHCKSSPATGCAAQSGPRSLAAGCAAQPGPIHVGH